MSQLHVILLKRAAETLGGADELARYLGVSPARVRVWLRGLVPPTDDVFLRLVDLLRPDSPPGSPDAPRRSGAP